MDIETADSWFCQYMKVRQLSVTSLAGASISFLGSYYLAGNPKGKPRKCNIQEQLGKELHSYN